MTNSEHSSGGRGVRTSGWWSAILWIVLATSASGDPIAEPIREHDLDVTLYVSETRVPDGRGMVVLLEITNVSGQKIRVSGPPIVRRIRAGEPRRHMDERKQGGTAPTGPLAPDNPKPKAPAKGKEVGNDDAAEVATPIITCTLADGVQGHPILRSGLVSGESRTIGPGDSYFLHVRIEGDEMGPGVCRLAAVLVGKTKLLGKSQVVSVDCIAPAKGGDGR
jgi:hypothetical protein